MGPYISSRLHNLENFQNRLAGAGDIQQGARDFSLSCTCPPSTSIIFRGGLAWWSSRSLLPAGFIIPTYEIDLADSSKCSTRITSGYTYTFTNAYWYVPALVIISYDLWAPSLGYPPYPDTVPDNAIRLLGGNEINPYFTEYKTTTEAESAIQSIPVDYATNYGIVGGGIILRNNGNIDAINQYMAVDPINRGRSYLFLSRRNGWQMG